MTNYNSNRRLGTALVGAMLGLALMTSLAAAHIPPLPIARGALATAVLGVRIARR